MEIKFKDTKSWLKEIEVTIESDQVKKKIEEITSSYADKAKIPGFRTGKIPRPVLLRRYGSTFESLALDDIFDEVYKNIIKENNLHPITQAKVTDYSLSDDKSLKFELSFEIIPDFELKNYVGLKLKKQEPTGFDEEFDKRVKALQERCSTFTTLNRSAENNDFLLTDYEILENDKPAAKKQNGIMIQLGSDKNHPQINQTLLGTKAGDEKSVSITFPKEYEDPEFANRTLQYKFYIRDVKERHLPEIDDTLASDLGFKNLDELRKQINEEILQDRVRVVEEDLKHQIYHYLVTEHNFESPNAYIESTYKEVLNEYGLKDSAETKQKLLNVVTERTKFDIIINRIAEKENIMPKPEDIEKELDRFRGAGIKPEQIEMLRTSPGFIARMIKNMVVDWLLNKAVVS
jgi:trigger factor